MLVCKWNKEEFCTNDECPMCADYCPVPNDEGICRYEERISDKEIKKETCKTCQANKVCNHDVYGFENCNNYIPEIVHCMNCQYWTGLNWDGMCLRESKRTYWRDYCSGGKGVKQNDCSK